MVPQGFLLFYLFCSVLAYDKNKNPEDGHGMVLSSEKQKETASRKSWELCFHSADKPEDFRTQPLVSLWKTAPKRCWWSQDIEEFLQQTPDSRIKRILFFSHSFWFCNSVDCSLPGSSVCGILQARILEWAVFPFSRGSSQPRNRTQVSRTAGGFFTSWVTREAQEYRNG